MTRAPSLLSSLPPDLQDAVMQAAETQTYGEIQEWLNATGVPANYSQVLRFVTSQGGSRAAYEWTIPAADHRERMRQYVDAVMAHKSELFTIRNIGLRGPIWTMCSRALLEAGLIEATRRYSPVLFRRLVSREELRVWLLHTTQAPP